MVRGRAWGKSDPCPGTRRGPRVRYRRVLQPVSLGLRMGGKVLNREISSCSTERKLRSSSDRLGKGTVSSGRQRVEAPPLDERQPVEPTQEEPSGDHPGRDEVRLDAGAYEPADEPARPTGECEGPEPERSERAHRAPRSRGGEE